MKHPLLTALRQATASLLDAEDIEAALSEQGVRPSAAAIVTGSTGVQAARSLRRKKAD